MLTITILKTRSDNQCLEFLWGEKADAVLNINPLTQKRHVFLIFILGRRGGGKILDNALHSVAKVIVRLFFVDEDNQLLRHFAIELEQAQL